MAISLSSRGGLVLVVGLLLVTAGCGGAGTAAPSGGDADGRQEDPRATAAPGESDDGATAAQIRQRAIIRTGEMEVTVEDFETARANISEHVRALGGFTSDSQVEVHTTDAGTYRTGQLVLRVPSENFTTMLERARAVGTVESARTSSKDVTDQLVDLEARLANLRAERDRLRQLYRNTTDTDDVLDVEERLSEVQGEIERLEAQQTSLERQVALSTIRIRLNEPAPQSPPNNPSQFHETPVLGAFLASVDGVIVTVRAIVVALAYALPYLLVFGTPLVGAAYVAKNSDTVKEQLRSRRD